MLNGYLADCGRCPYLPDRRFRAFIPEASQGSAVWYRQLMDLRFRRSGNQVYMPMCEGCSACQPIRVEVAGFQPRADQRRCWARNTDLTVTLVPRGCDDERTDLYRRYQAAVHGKDARQESAAMLIEDGGVSGGELHARDAQGTLVAVSVVDLFDDALSSVYCYYDPAARRRGLGTYMALAEIAHARAQALTWLYLGFFVAGCAKMEYKKRFGPAELLVDGEWVQEKTKPQAGSRPGA